MRLQRLIVENLGPIESVDLDLTPVTVVMGSNESGKSFLAVDALEVLRFGSCRGLKAKDALVFTRNGTKGYAVEAVLGGVAEGEGGEDLPFSIRRTRSQAPDSGVLDEALGDVRLWRALLQAGGFLDMKPADRKALVADLLARDTTELVEKLQGQSAPREILDAVERGDMRKAHRLATERRRGFTRELQTIRNLQGEGVETPLVQTKKGQRPVSELPIEAIDKALEVARGRRDKAEDAHRDARDRRKAEGDLKAAEAELGQLGGGEPWGGERASRLEELKRRCDENRLKAKEAVAEANVNRPAADVLRQLVHADDAECPTCGQDLAPAKARASAALEELDRKVAEATKRADTLAKEHKKLDDERHELQAIKDRWEQEKSYRIRLEHRIKELRGKLQGDAPSEAGAEAAAAEVRRLESIRDTRVRYDAALATHEKASVRLEELELDEANAKDVEELCSPDNLEDEGSALDELNAFLREWAPVVFPGPWVDVHADWEVYYAGRIVNTASDSAKIRAGLLCACALAHLSGARCVFVDRLEALDDATRSKLLNMLGRMVRKGVVETAICAVVKDKPKAPPKIPSWLQVVAMEDGHARVLAPGGE